MGLFHIFTVLNVNFWRSGRSSHQVIQLKSDHSEPQPADVYRDEREGDGHHRVPGHTPNRGQVYHAATELSAPGHRTAR